MRSREHLSPLPRPARLGRAVPTAAVLAVVLAAALPVGGGRDAAAQPVAGAPVRSIEVTGASSAPQTGIWPAYAPGATRYALRGATAGEVTLRARSNDPGAKFFVDGIPDEDGTVTLSGLSPGREVSVVVEDSGGRTPHALIVVPDNFPELEGTGPAAGQAAGLTLLTLTARDGQGNFLTAVDKNGVPAWLSFMPPGRTATDLKPHPAGGYSFLQSSPGPGTGSDTVVWNERLEEVDRVRSVGLVNSGQHDVEFLPDGSRIHQAYEYDANGRQDAVVQQVAADGSLLREWNSADVMHPVPVDMRRDDPGAAAAAAATDTVLPFRTHADAGIDGTADPDYAHVNSVQLVDDGANMLLSFRHTSSVMKVAWAADRTDGRTPGEVIWRLGGRFSDFSITDLAGNPDGGPCAQHSARQLAPGTILVFDNGAPGADAGGGLAGNNRCIDPADPTGTPVGRTHSRVTEYALDETAGTARMVREYAFTSPGESTRDFAYFAGNVTRLDNGNDLVGWSSTRRSVATEFDPDGHPVWNLREVRAAGAYVPASSSYRAAPGLVPDALAPTVHLDSLADGTPLALGEQPTPTASCRDTGGSTLQTCVTTVTGVPGSTDVRVRVVARDGAGNSTEVTRVHPPRTSPTGVPEEPPTQAATPALVWTPAKRTVRGTDSVRFVLTHPTADPTATPQRVRLRLRGPSALRRTLVVRVDGRSRTVAALRRGVRFTVAPGDRVRVVLRRDPHRPRSTGRVQLVARPDAGPTRRAVVRVRR